MFTNMDILLSMVKDYYSDITAIISIYYSYTIRNQQLVQPRGNDPSICFRWELHFGSVLIIATPFGVMTTSPVA